MQLYLEEILLPVTTSGSMDNRIFDGGKTGGPFPRVLFGICKRDQRFCTKDESKKGVTKSFFF